MAKTARIIIRRSYNFIDKDPVLDRVAALIKRRGLTRAYHKLGRLTGMAASTFANWEEGATKRPQHASIACLAEALGAKFELVDDNPASFELEKELASAKRWWIKNKPRKAAKKKPAKKRNLKLAA
jgi:transcriptional regulator with XRE-family HTH domain